MTSTASSPPRRPRLHLALNSAEDRLQVAAGLAGEDRTELVFSEELSGAGGSMPILSPAIERALAAADARPEDISGIACVRGPGSFTGLRIALSTAAGFLAGKNIPLAGLELLPLIAASAPRTEAAILAVVTYARRGQVYLQTFDARSRAPRCGLVHLTAGAALEALGSLKGTTAVAGSGLRRCLDAASLPGNVLALSSQHDRPTPQALLEAAAKALHRLAPIEPLYVRVSDAEENIETIARARGLDPERARRRMAALLDPDTPS